MSIRWRRASRRLSDASRAEILNPAVEIYGMVSQQAADSHDWQARVLTRAMIAHLRYGDLKPPCNILGSKELFVYI